MQHIYGVQHVSGVRLVSHPLSLAIPTYILELLKREAPIESPNRALSESYNHITDQAGTLTNNYSAAH